MDAGRLACPGALPVAPLVDAGGRFGSRRGSRRRRPEIAADLAAGAATGGGGSFLVDLILDDSEAR